MIHKKLYGMILFYSLASAIAFFMLLPFFWMLSTSLKSHGALIIVPIEWIPKKISLQGFERLFETIKPEQFLRVTGNSFYVSIMTIIIVLTSSSMAAYAFAKIPFKHKEKLFALFLATMMVPFQIVSIPNYIILRQFGLLSTFTGLLLPSIFNAFAVFLLRQHINKINNDFIDAAIIDGANHLRIYKNVILPLIAPILAALGVITFMGSWNAYYWPLIVLNTQEKFTLPVQLGVLSGQHFTHYNILMAAGLLSMIPIILLYIFAQKYFEAGLQMGGLKA